MIGLSFVNRASKSRSESPCGCSLRRLEFHQVHDVDDAHLEFRQVLANQVDGGERFQRRHVAATGHDYVRLAALVVRGPFPNAETFRAMLDRLLHGQPLRGRLLARDHHVDIVAAAQAVVGHRQKAIGVRRQVDAHDLGLFVDDMIDEAWVLMAKPVVVLSPDVGA